MPSEPTQDYLQLYQAFIFGYEHPTGFMTLALLSLARMFPIVALAPYLGARLLPHPVKAAIAISLFAINLPKIVAVVSPELRYSPFIIILLLKEVFIGIIIGLMTTIPSFIVQGAGVLIDHQRGGASLQIRDPAIENQASPIGTLYDLTYIYLFILAGGPFYLFDAIFQSYDVVPPDKLISSAFFTGASPFWKDVIDLFNHVMKMLVQLASPSLIAILMTDVFLGIANRLAPQVMITFLGMPLKSLLALVLIYVGWKPLLREMVKMGLAWMAHVTETVHYFGV